MVSTLSALVVVAALAACVSGRATRDEVAKKGEAAWCDSKAMHYLDSHKLRGEWLERESFNGKGLIEDHTCHASFFYPSEDGKTISVSNSYRNTDKAEKKYSFIISDKDPRPDGNLVANMKIAQLENAESEVEFDILGTDYTTYMVAQICMDNPGTDKDFKAVLLYVKEDPIEGKFEDALNANGLDREAFIPTMPNICPAVVFPALFKAEA